MSGNRSRPVIPAPVRFDDGAGQFAFRPGTRIAYADPGVAPIAERFCSEITRRTGLRVAPVAGRPGPGEPCVRIEPATGDELGALPAPLGLSPTGDHAADERHSLVIDADQAVVRAAGPAGVARALTTLTQLLAAAPSGGARELSLPCGRILDAPRYAWRGLSLDLARTFLTLGEVRRVVDLLALYKLNVLHVHLTDDQSWRLPVGRSAEGPAPDAAYYSGADLRALVAYAADRFVTVVPEVDTPGHASAFVQMHPELNTGRNEVDYEILPGHARHAVWLDPELPATFELIEQVLAGGPRSSRARISTSAVTSPAGCPTTCTPPTSRGCAASSARSASARWAGRSRRAPASAGTMSSSTGSPAPPFRRPCRRRSERRWTRTSSCRAATSRRPRRQRCL